MTSEMNGLIQAQYKSPGLTDDIFNRLYETGIYMGSLKRSDIAGVDEFHVRGAEVSKELADSTNMESLKVLDVGCGLGGPARMLASDYNCSVTGIDICPDYINTARNLSAAVGLTHTTEFLQGDALDLPFENERFDVVWTQHVQMNVKDKKRFYSEIHRVLTPTGKLIYYDIFTTGKKDVQYPVPWANTSEISHLRTVDRIKEIIGDLRFTKVESKDQTIQALNFLNEVFKKMEAEGPPTIGLNVLMGADTKKKLGNIRQGIIDGAIELHSGIFQKNTQVL